MNPLFIYKKKAINLSLHFKSNSCIKNFNFITLKEFRAQGAEIAQKIRSTADKDVTVILAEANKKSEII